MRMSKFNKYHTLYALLFVVGGLLLVSNLQLYRLSQSTLIEGEIKVGDCVVSRYQDFWGRSGIKRIESIDNENDIYVGVDLETGQRVASTAFHVLRTNIKVECPK